MSMSSVPDDIETYVNYKNTFFAKFNSYEFSEECNNVMSGICKTNDVRIAIQYEHVLQSHMCSTYNTW